MSITQWHSNIKSRSIKETSYLNNCHLRSLLFLAGDVNSGMIHWLLTDLPTKPILASPVLATSNPAESVRQFHQLSYSVWRHLNTHMRAILDSRPKLYLLLEWWRRPGDFKLITRLSHFLLLTQCCQLSWIMRETQVFEVFLLVSRLESEISRVIAENCHFL